MTIELPEVFLWIFLGLATVNCTLSAVELYYRRKARKAEDLITANQAELRAVRNARDGYTPADMALSQH